MNTDIRLSTGFWDHPKTIKLERRIGLLGVKALLVLWTWVSQCRPNGYLQGMSVEDIEIAARWTGEPGLFVKTAVELKLLDDVSHGEYAVHDWIIHNSWAADADNRADESRLNILKRWNMEAYLKLVNEGKKGISKEEYEALKQNRIGTPIAPMGGANTPYPLPSPLPVPNPLPVYKDIENSAANAASVSEGDVPETIRAKKTIPDCPYQQILDAYHELCALNPRVQVFSKRLKGSLKARWSEDQRRQNLAWWRWYFDYIAQSKFLTGRTEPRPGRPPFVADFDWILTPSGMDHILCGRYHRDVKVRDDTESWLREVMGGATAENDDAIDAEVFGNGRKEGP